MTAPNSWPSAARRLMWPGSTPWAIWSHGGVSTFSAAAPATARTARAKAETEPEPGAEAGAETSAETERPVVTAVMVTQVFEEFVSGVPPAAAQGTPLCGARSETESEAWLGREGPGRRSQWVVHIRSPLRLRSTTHGPVISRYIAN